MARSRTCSLAVDRTTIRSFVNRRCSGLIIGRPLSRSPGTSRRLRSMAIITFQRRRHLFDAAFDGCFPIPDCFASYDSILLVSRVQKACPRPNVRETSSIRQSNGLLIRRFGVRFPGLPPFPRNPRTSSQGFGTQHSQSVQQVAIVNIWPLAAM